MTQMRWLKLAGLCLILTAVLTITLIASGFFDPKPKESLVWQSEPTSLVIEAGSSKTIWLTDLPEKAFSIQTTIIYQNGEPDSDAGIILNGPCAQLFIVISPLGYASVRQIPITSDACSPITEMPRQPWPHVNQGAEANELWLDVAEGLITVRVNREILWQVEAEPSWQQFGLFGESFGEPAEFEFQASKLFTD